MPFIAALIGLLIFSAVGSYRLRVAGPERYGPFMYACAVWWGLLPLLAGNWTLSLVALPIGLVVARLMVRRRAAEVAVRPTTAVPRGTGGVDES